MVDTTGPGPTIDHDGNGRPVFLPARSPSEASDAWRREADSLGEMDIPADAYWGIHTARALENFPITRRAISNYPDLIVALARVKQAACRANRDLGVLDDIRAEAIDRACQEIIDGQLHEEFVLGAIQGGAGTSTNMCANEVIANRALEILGHAKGDYHHLHPIDHVNRSQSTNDVYPTAIKLAMVRGIEAFQPEHRALADAFGVKANEFRDILKVGVAPSSRTRFQ